MSVGREWQGLFDEARDKVVKCVTLAKSLKDDIYNFPDSIDVLKESVDSLIVIKNI